MKLKNIKIDTRTGLIYISVITVVVIVAIQIYSRITLQKRIKDAAIYMSASIEGLPPCDSSCKDTVTLKNGEELHGAVVFEHENGIDFIEVNKGASSVRSIAKNHIVVLKKETKVEIVTENEPTCYAIVKEILGGWKEWKTAKPSRAYFIQINGRDPAPEFMKKIIVRHGSFQPASKFKYDLEHNTKISISLA